MRENVAKTLFKTNIKIWTYWTKLSFILWHLISEDFAKTGRAFSKIAALKGTVNDNKEQILLLKGVDESTNTFRRRIQNVDIFAVYYHLQTNNIEEMY